ncbi:uncharacterized protein TRAVEDRAFT_168762, partial [Trametes versicolor FP-101664 SS1]|uniref:uncharacterized protein n=1 Tax=Trametes versicolor (strain FP-101664) TaxID=717944 RepID=UPI000462265E
PHDPSRRTSFLPIYDYCTRFTIGHTNVDDRDIVSSASSARTTTTPQQYDTLDTAFEREVRNRCEWLLLIAVLSTPLQHLEGCLILSCTCQATDTRGSSHTARRTVCKCAQRPLD